MDLGEVTAAQIHVKSSGPIGITGINNRLNDLVEMGLLLVRKEGKQKYFRAPLKTGGSDAAQL